MNLDLNLILSIGGAVVIGGAWLFFSVMRRINRGELFDEQQERLIDTLRLLKAESERPHPAIQRRRIEAWTRKDRAGSG